MVMKPPVDTTIQDLLTKQLIDIEIHYDADVICYFGPVVNGNENLFLQIIEDLVTDANKKERLFVILTTTGGSAVTVERYVNIIRHHYQEVNFIVPDYAYSAGTIWCMSGDNIFMDYFSVLGPIDPQVQNKDGKWVAALGYLDKVNDMLMRSRSGSLSQAEFLILRDIDLAELRGYEQAKELTIDLLKKWLVKYKFKNWHTHATNPNLIGTPVTEEDKMKRAEEIADALSNNNIWKSHGRPINIETLESEMRLKIEDFSNDHTPRNLIRTYYNLLSNYIIKNNFNIFIHTRKFT
jgi:Serine dehydrogenase proteinase